MRKWLGWIFSRWTLGAILLIALLILLWVVGPLIAIGELRPLDTDRSRWIATAVLLTVVVLTVAWKVWRARKGNSAVVDQLLASQPAGAGQTESADLKAVRQRFEDALGTLSKARFGQAGEGWLGRLRGRLSGRYLYELPWYVIIGAPGSGKTTALRNSGLRFPLADRHGEQGVRGVGGTRNCDWWFTEQAVLIDTAGRFTTQDSDHDNDSAAWSGFLELLRSTRSRQPLNGVMVTVSVSDLMGRGAAERLRHATTVRQRVQELHQKLQIRFPIYLLVTKCDLMSGFMDAFQSLGKEQRATPWGFTFALDPKSGTSDSSAFCPEFDALVARLDDGLIDVLQSEPDVQRRARIYSFPGQFAGLRDMLKEFVDTVFSPSAFEAQPLLRGVYFISGTQEGTPIDRVLGAVARRYQLESMVLPPNQSSGKSFFLSRLLSEVVFAEQGLAGTHRGWERRRTALVIGGYAALGVLGIGSLLAWFVSYGNNARYVETVARRADDVRRLVQETPNRHSADLVPVIPALEATRGLADAGGVQGEAPWSMRFGLYQGRKLDTAARAAYERMLVDALLPRLALRVEDQLRGGDQPELLYEALKTYLMMYDPQRFDEQALKSHVEADWDVRLGREMTSEQRVRLSRHLDSLLALGPAVSPIAQDKALVDSVRTRLATVSLPQRVYNRIRQRGLGNEFPEFTVAKAGGPNAPLVFTRASGLPLTKGVPGLFSYAGYHSGFQKVVGDVTGQLAAEQGWVLGIKTEGGSTTLDAAIGAGGRLSDDVRRLYLTEYATVWEGFIADIRLVPVTGIAQSVQVARLLAAPDSPLPPLLKAMSKETTLLVGSATVDAAAAAARSLVQTTRDRMLGSVGVRLPSVVGTPTPRIESIVDDRFEGLRRMVTAPEGGKPPIDGVMARLAELQVHLTAVESALRGGGAPQPSPLPNQIKAEAANSPQPVRGLLDTLGSSTSKVAQIQLRESLSRDVRSQVGEFCQQAVAGRYPFDRSSTRDVTQADFAAVFGPGGKFDQMQQKLAPYIDTSTRPSWTFRPIDGTPLGSDVGTLPQFQRAAAIRETFFGSGTTAAVRLEFKPTEMDPGLTQFVLDVDGQVVRYAHGPQIPSAVQWPGPRGSGVVRVMVTPSTGSGMVYEGPWALFRMFERVGIQEGNSRERFRATFDLDGRKATFDVTTSSVRNPFRLRELTEFSCPNGL